MSTATVEKWNNVEGDDRGPWMDTYSGKRFHFLSPSMEEIDFHDIAHATGKLCRYGGHCKRFFSVAEHSVRVAQWVAAQTGDTQLAFEALMHDAGEGYLVDVPRPIKRRLSQYKDIERIVERAIARKFGLRYPLHALIHEADNRIIEDERQQNMCKNSSNWSEAHKVPLGIRLFYWSPDEAPKLFLRYFNDLDSRLKAGMPPGALLHG